MRKSSTIFWMTNSYAVPRKTNQMKIRIGVTAKASISRAVSLTGTMSP